MPKFNVVSIRVKDNKVLGYDGGCGCCMETQYLSKDQLREFIEELKAQLSEAEKLLETDNLFE